MRRRPTSPINSDEDDCRDGDSEHHYQREQNQNQLPAAESHECHEWIYLHNRTFAGICRVYLFPPLTEENPVKGYEVFSR